MSSMIQASTVRPEQPCKNREADPLDMQDRFRPIGVIMMTKAYALRSGSSFPCLN